MPMAVMLYKWFVLCLLSAGLPGDGARSSLLSGETKAHPFYVSVTEINHNNKDKALEISCKIFADDFEETLKRNYKASVDLTNQQHHQQIDKLAKDYISRHFSLAADGRAIALTYVGFEKDKESVYCYFEVQNLAAIKKLDVTNSILQDFTNEQINIMHVTVNGKRQSVKLDYPDKKASFAF